MPAALEVDHDKVRAVAIQVGVREAARQFGLSEDAVRQWSKRERWFKHAQVVQDAIVRKQKNQGLSPDVTKSVSDVLLAYDGKSKLRSAVLGHKMLQAISRKRDDALIACAQPFATTVTALDKVHRWSQPSQTNVQVNVNLGSTQFKDSPK